MIGRMQKYVAHGKNRIVYHIYGAIVSSIVRECYETHKKLPARYALQSLKEAAYL